jgi:hypothetical protein
MNSENNNQSDYYANCRVSTPILYPDQQLVSFNGFAWSDSMGMIHEVSPMNDQGWQQWLGTQQ